MDRRRLLLGTAALAAGAGSPALAMAQTARTRRPPVKRLDREINELQRRTFDWFVEVTDTRTGMTPDRWPTAAMEQKDLVGQRSGVMPVRVADQILLLHRGGRLHPDLLARGRRARLDDARRGA